MTLKMTTAQVVETSVTVTNSSFQNYTHPDDHTTRTTDTPGFKPFTIYPREFGKIDFLKVIFIVNNSRIYNNYCSHSDNITINIIMFIYTNNYNITITLIKIIPSEQLKNQNASILFVSCFLEIYQLE